MLSVIFCKGAGLLDINHLQENNCQILGLNYHTLSNIVPNENDFP